MSASGYPALEPEKSWIEKHPRLIVGVIIAVVFAVGVFAVVEKIFHSSEAYRQALAAVSKSPEVAAKFGSPVEAGWLINGSIQVSGSTGRAELSFPISGPKAKGDVRVFARKRFHQWELLELEVAIAGDSTILQLIPAADVPKAPGPDR